MNIAIEQRHAEMVKALVKDPGQIMSDMTPMDCDLWHGITGICTEAGELLDAIKKVVIYNKPFDRENMIEELGDIEFYMQQVRDRLGITREATLQANMDKLAVRYAQYKYSDQQAHERKDKQ